MIFMTTFDLLIFYKRIGAQILEERLSLRTFLSSSSLWMSLVIDKGSSIVRSFSSNPVPCKTIEDVKKLSLLILFKLAKAGNICEGNGKKQQKVDSVGQSESVSVSYP